MDWYEDEVRWLERRAADAPAEPVAFYGSSSVRMWDTLAADFSGLPVVNLGFGGSTLAACAHFFDRLVPPVRPRSVVVYAGDNDLGDGQSAAAVVASFRALAARAADRLPGVRLVFVSVKPSPARWGLRDRMTAVNRDVRAALDGRPGGAFVDVYTPMLGPDGGPRPELYAADGLHLSPAGYRLWADALNGRRALFA
ncbi:MAG: SGNH/GDSL hydrolase family protein [Fimbriiglobus sp.]